MIDWLRRIDPGFYHKEPHLLRTHAQIARYTEEEQAEVRLSVLTADPVLRAATTIVALALFAAVAAAGALDTRRDWLTLGAFAVLAVAGLRALPWWPHGDRHERVPIVLLVLAVGVAFGARTSMDRFFVAPLVVGVLAAAAAVLAVRAIARVWPRRPQLATWSGLATVLLTFAYLFAFRATELASRIPFEVVMIAVAYLGVCVIAGRIRRAELIARPPGVLTLPQSIVPLLDRSHDHAVICWRCE